MDDQEFKAEAPKIKKLVGVSTLYVLTTTDQFSELRSESRQFMELVNSVPTLVE